MRLWQLPRRTAVNAFPEDKGVPLYWTQPLAEKKVYELRAQNELVAQLSFEKAGGTTALGETTVETWKFVRKGLLDSTVYISKSGEEKVIAAFKPKWTVASGTLEFGSEKSYLWKQTNLWSAEYSFSSREMHVREEESDQENGADRENNSLQQSGSTQSGAAGEGEQLVTFRSTGPFKHSVSVELHRTSAVCEELPLLAILGWYLILIYWDDSTAITTAINAATM